MERKEVRFFTGREEFDSAFFQLESSVVYFFDIFELDDYWKFLRFYSRQLLDDTKTR